MNEVKGEALDINTLQKRGLEKVKLPRNNRGAPNFIQCGPGPETNRGDPNFIQCGPCPETIGTTPTLYNVDPAGHDPATP